MSSMFEKPGVITDPEARDRWKMAGDHGDRCQVCHRPCAKANWRGFAIHHIIHGANGRSDEPCNFLLVCADCHSQVHDGNHRDGRTGERMPAITLGMVLWLKSYTDDWNEERLKQLSYRALPAWEILPNYYMAERIRNRGL